MNNIEYKACKKLVGPVSRDIWCALLGIAKDTDKSYSCGRSPIPEHIDKKLGKLVKNKEIKAGKLANKLRETFSDDCYVIIRSTESNDISLQNKSGLKILFVNEGTDMFNHDVYSFKSKKGLRNIMLYYPENPYQAPRNDDPNNDRDWFYWDGHLAHRRRGPYHHSISIELILELVGSN